MYTKSKILQILEIQDIKESFKNDIYNLLENYNINDSIFYINTNTKRLDEACDGYFEQDSETEYNDLNEALKDFDFLNEGIRIINNEKFYRGKLYKNLNESKDITKVFNIHKC